MANPFDQFDAPQAGNPFDQFDAPVGAPGKGDLPPQKSVKDFITRAIPNDLGEMAHGIGSAVNYGLGTATGAVTNGLNAILPQSMQIQPQNDTQRQWLQNANNFPADISNAAQAVKSLGDGAISSIPGVQQINDWAVQHGLLPAYDKTNENSDKQLFYDAVEPINTLQKFGDMLYEHPVQSAANVAALATGGGELADAAGMAKLASGLKTAGEFTNPINIVGKPLNVLKNVVAPQTQMAKMLADMPPASQALADTQAQARGLWKGIEDQNIQFPAQTYQPFADKLRQSFAGIDSAAPQASALKNQLLNQLSPFDATPKPVDTLANGQPTMVTPTDTRTVPFNEVNNIKTTVGALARDGKASNVEQLGAQKILSAINELYGSQPGLTDALAPANEMSRRKILGEQLQKMNDKSQWYLGGDESGLRNQVSSFGKSQGQNLTPQEQEAYKAVVSREGLNSIVNSAGSKLGSMIMGGVGATLGGIPGMAIAGGGHYGARKLSEMLTSHALDNAIKTVLMGKEAQQAGSLPLPGQAFNAKLLGRALLSGSAPAPSMATQQQ